MDRNPKINTDVADAQAVLDKFALRAPGFSAECIALEACETAKLVLLVHDWADSPNRRRHARRCWHRLERIRLRLAHDAALDDQPALEPIRDVLQMTMDMAADMMG